MQTHTGPIALSGPLKFSVVNVNNSFLAGMRQTAMAFSLEILHCTVLCFIHTGLHNSEL